MKTPIRHVKRQYIKQVAETAEKAAKKNDLKELYHTTRLLAGNFKVTSDLPIKAKGGTLLIAQTDINNRWIEHFTELLNRPPPNKKFEFDPTPPIEDQNIELGPITKAEVIKAISSIKNNKAPGIDEIPGELLKANEPTALNRLVNFYSNLWDGEKIPNEWKMGVIIKIPKKGNLNECGNWRGITILSIPYKIYCIIILNRITKTIDNKLRENQCGFRVNRSCIDHIFTLRNILEQSHE